jgi:hypothetical protein
LTFGILILNSPSEKIWVFTVIISELRCEAIFPANSSEDGPATINESTFLK